VRVRLFRRRHHSKVGVPSQFDRPGPGSFGEVALGQSLEPPRDATKKPRTVVAVGLFAEHLGVLFLELLGGHPLQRGDLFLDVQVH
jgi:hypothetical protein